MHCIYFLFVDMVFFFFFFGLREEQTDRTRNDGRLTNYRLGGKKKKKSAVTTWTEE